MVYTLLSDLMFSYIHMLTHAGPQAHLWDELQATAAMEFRFQDKIDSVDYGILLKYSNNELHHKTKKQEILCSLRCINCQNRPKITFLGQWGGLWGGVSVPMKLLLSPNMWVLVQIYGGSQSKYVGRVSASYLGCLGEFLSLLFYSLFFPQLREFLLI